MLMKRMYLRLLAIAMLLMPATLQAVAQKEFYGVQSNGRPAAVELRTQVMGLSFLRVLSRWCSMLRWQTTSPSR